MAAISHGSFVPRQVLALPQKAIKPPIVIDQEGDVLIFRTPEEAEGYLESPDIVEGRYVAYDSEGQLLKLEAPGAWSILGFIVGTERVSVQPGQEQATHADALRALLVRRLASERDWREEWMRATLPELLEKAVERLGFTS